MTGKRAKKKTKAIQAREAGIYHISSAQEQLTVYIHILAYLVDMGRVRDSVCWVRDGAELLDCVQGCEGRPAVEHLVQDAAEGPNVAASA